MDLKKYKEGFSSLYNEAVIVQQKVDALTPSYYLSLRRAPMRRIEDALQNISLRLTALDKERIAEFPNEQPGSNASVMLGASHFLAYNLRETVRSSLASSQDSLNNLHIKLDFLFSVSISLVALVVSICALR